MIRVARPVNNDNVVSHTHTGNKLSLCWSDPVAKLEFSPRTDYKIKVANSSNIYLYGAFNRHGDSFYYNRIFDVSTLTNTAELQKFIFSETVSERVNEDKTVNLATAVMLTSLAYCTGKYVGTYSPTV